MLHAPPQDYATTTHALQVDLPCTPMRSMMFVMALLGLMAAAHGQPLAQLCLVPGCEWHTALLASSAACIKAAT